MISPWTVASPSRVRRLHRPSKLSRRANRTVLAVTKEASAPALVDELAELRSQVAALRAENARLLRLLKLTPRQAAPPGPVQTGFFEAPPGPVHSGSPPKTKVAFFAALFAARTDIYATRWENQRTGKSGWLPRSGADGVKVSGTPIGSTRR